MTPIFCISNLARGVGVCLAASMLASCQSAKSSSEVTRPTQGSEVIYSSAAPRPHVFAFEAHPPNHVRMPTADGPGMECLHHVATTLAITGRIPLAVGAGTIGFAASGCRPKVGLGVAGWVLDQPLP